jgi:phosphopentomutase
LGNGRHNSRTRISDVPGILGNVPASGTEILKVLGDEHVRTRKPIVYTSADSVFQIAAHEAVIPLERV